MPMDGSGQRFKRFEFSGDKDVAAALNERRAFKAGAKFKVFVHRCLAPFAGNLGIVLFKTF